MQRLLVVDSNQSYCAGVQRVFTSRGYAVKTCGDRRTAMELIHSFRPTVVVMELRLDDGPCLSLLKWLKQSYPEAKVVVLTNHGSIATAVKCMRLGADSYREKTLTLDQVIVDIEQEVPVDEVLPEQPRSLDRAVWEYINQVVEHAGSIAQGARLLGLDRRSLRRMLAKYAPPETQLHHQGQ